MGISSGPYNPRDGLVLWYDFANTKSFRGEPVTNFFTNGHFSGGQGIPQESGSNPTNEIIQFPNPGGSDWVLRQTGPGQFTEYQIVLTTQLSSSTTYVMSGWYAESSDYQGADGSRMFHARAFSSTGAHQATGIGIGTVIETRVIGGIVWKYCYQTITTPSNYSNLFDWYLGYGGQTFSGNRYYTNIQMELGSYPKKFANGTRGTTVATGGGVIDLSNASNHGELINGPTSSLTFGGGLVFDGTNDYINTNLTGVVNDLTVECWYRGTKATRNHLWDFGSAAQSTNLNFNFNDTGYDLWVYWEGGGTNRARYSIDGSFTDGTVKHIVFRHTGSTNQVYLNGALVPLTESGGVQTFTNVNGTGIFSIGGSIAFSGEIYTVKVYRKALSATEILQSYNSTRTRFITRETIITSGLVLNLDAGDPNSFRRTGTTWRDVSGYGNNVILASGPYFRPENGGSILFDGTDDYAYGPYIGSIGKIPLHAFEIWVKSPGLGTNQVQGGLICPDYGMVTYITFTGDVFYGLYNTDSQPYAYLVSVASSGTNIYDNRWHHIVCTRGSSTCEIYIDGIQKVTAGNGGAWSGQTIWSNSMSIQIGNNPNDGIYHLKGNIAIARIYNKYLTATEVLQNYNATKSRFGLN